MRKTFNNVALSQSSEYYYFMLTYTCRYELIKLYCNYIVLFQICFCHIEMFIVFLNVEHYNPINDKIGCILLHTT